MKIKEGYLLDSIGQQKIAVALDGEDEKFVGMIKLNAVAAFLWEQLQQETDEQKLINALMEEYEVDEEKAAADVRKYVETLKKYKILEN